MTDLEAVAAATVAHLVRTAGRTDEGEGLWAIVVVKLATDSALAKLQEQAKTGTLTTRTERRVVDALVEAAEADSGFATNLSNAVQALHDCETRTGTGGSVLNTISGTVHGPVIQGRDFHGSITLGG